MKTAHSFWKLAERSPKVKQFSALSGVRKLKEDADNKGRMQISIDQFYYYFSKI